MRGTLVVSGFTNHCKNCFQPQTWDFCYGQPFTEETERETYAEPDKPYVGGLSLLGGDPFEPENQRALLPMLRRIREKYPQKNIWCYTGYAFESLLRNPRQAKLLEYIDVLVDGKFRQELRDEDLYFRGSRNQRLIDVQASLKANKTVSYRYNPGI